jgi:anion transporter
MLPICSGLVEAFGVEKGRSGYGAALMMVAMAANNVSSTAFLTATVPNPISARYLSVVGVSLDWGGWLKMAFPLSLILLVSSYLLATGMFKSEVNFSHETFERIREMRKSLGHMNQSEITVAVLFSTLLLLWVGERYVGFNVGLISLVLSLILFLPRIGAMNIWGFSKSTPWGSITLFAASMFMANAVEKWRALDPIAEAIFSILALDRLGSTTFVLVLVLLAVLLHVAFTSTTVYATVMVPLTMSLAQLHGVPPQLIGLPVAFLAPVAVVLPVNTIPNIVFYKEGWFNQRQMVVYGLVLSLLSVTVVLLIGIPYWMFLGLI